MIKIRQIKILVNEDENNKLLQKISKKLKIALKDIEEYKITKKAIDARNKKEIYFVYEVVVKVKNENRILKNNHNPDILKVENDEYQLPKKGKEKLQEPIVVIGSGPAGLFASFLLVKAGFKVIIIERGKEVIERIKDVEKFWQTGYLNTESNVQFGEGGAGTFSDGKLNTLIKDSRNIGKLVMDIFVLCGAPEEIKYLHNPHIGTDNLRIVIKNMRQKIIDMGGEFRFQTKMTDLIIEENKIKGIIVNENEKIITNNVILAIGHSARDTFLLLKEKKVEMENKPFAVGIRIMHPQKMIDDNQYGNFQKYLPPASYKLSYLMKDNRGVYSFCMCPGGYVVNSSSLNNKLCINGMSDYKRDSSVANSAIVITVNEKDYGYNLFDGMKFQEKLETIAFDLSNGKIPVQKWIDFKNNTLTDIKKPLKIKGSYTCTNIRKVLPSFITSALLEAIPYFAKKIPGFDNEEAIIAIIESRTSSPIRILRNNNFESNILGLYPAGEGAGYAGGITSSAIDGIKVAEALIKKYY